MPVSTLSYPAAISTPPRHMTSSSSSVLPPSAVLSDFAPLCGGQVQYITPGTAFCPAPGDSPMVHDGQHSYIASRNDLCGSVSFILPSPSMYCEVPGQNAQLPSLQPASPHCSHGSEHLRPHQMSRANSAPASTGSVVPADPPQYARHPDQHIGSAAVPPPLVRAATSPAGHSTAPKRRDRALSYRYYHPYGVPSFEAHPPSTEPAPVRSLSQPSPATLVRSDSSGHTAMSRTSSFSSQASAQEIANMFAAYTTEDDYIGGEFQNMFHSSFSLGP
ncbi:hypothetical protein C8Q80DRAFT_1172169 [Daedaleopsis nitida]|nr:hypothetical protein C8Q80DRAFT_1172169 [Daedaleopsis nitida]